MTEGIKNGIVYALAVHNNFLYVGGHFDFVTKDGKLIRQFENIPAKCHWNYYFYAGVFVFGITKFNILTQEWVAMDAGINGYCGYENSGRLFMSSSFS